jgi:tungstate transport system substrate-binding protein
LRLWRTAGLTPEALNPEKWYRDIGGGMGQALNAASAMNAYTLTDRGTWLSFKNTGSLIIIIEGDSRLINRYNVIELNPRKHEVARLDAAKIFADWLVSPEGQQAIGAYQVDGQQLFHPSATSPK